MDEIHEIHAALFDLRTALYAVPGAWQAVNPAYQTAEARIIKALRYTGLVAVEGPTGLTITNTFPLKERPDGR